MPNLHEIIHSPAILKLYNISSKDYVLSSMTWHTNTTNLFCSNLNNYCIHLFFEGTTIFWFFIKITENSIWFSLHLTWKHQGLFKIDPLRITIICIVGLINNRTLSTETLWFSFIPAILHSTLPSLPGQNSWYQYFTSSL